MGWHTNYEIEFADYIEWDEDKVAGVLPYTVKYLYLRDLEKPRVMLCMYSQSSVKEVLYILKTLYRVDMRYRFYDTEEWIAA